MPTSFLRIVVNRTITYVSIILVDYLSSEVFGMIFLSDYRIVEEKKRYEKLNDAAYSALKCRDCAASDWFKQDVLARRLREVHRLARRSRLAA